ncbi:MAG: NAD(P)-dependent glycerol-3-phosphate dehydrogenase [Oscillospiraceae bacterium]|nr:NAD(P)-dependent glycerol-3-phosphate dehydrogenase [Oscillospiraceae bacterium]
MKIFVMGAGSFGISLAVMAHRLGHTLTLWSPFESEVNQLYTNRAHPKLLPGVEIQQNITITDDLEAVSDQDMIIVATPSFAVRETAKLLRGRAKPGTVVACVAKGLEADSYKTLSHILCEELAQCSHVALSGPSHAEEVVKGVPTTVVAASASREAARFVQDALSGEALRIYISDDVLGVELGGALKNVIALAAGVLDGLGSGDNTKAALMTRGMAEIARLGVVMGARSETFAGLSGMGDLIVTCSSEHSRNRRFGILVGQGHSPQDALAQVGMTVEGYACAKVAWELAQKQGVVMPITEQVYRVLYEGKDLGQAVRDLMGRPKRHESEEVWLFSRRD